MSDSIRLNCLVAAVFAAVLVSGANPAWSGGDFGPTPPPPVEPEPPKERKTFGLSGELTVEFQNDNNIDSDDPDAELSDLYNTTELAAELTINHFLSGHTSLTFEPVLDPDPGDDRFFEDQGLYAEELYAKVALGGGRFRNRRQVQPGLRQGLGRDAWRLRDGLCGRL